MRLLNTRSEKFEEFFGRRIPEYAILSHTWEEDEVSYQDYLSGIHKDKKGYSKIKKTLSLARTSEIPYAWVDTCCINKSDSAELTETINSMYTWYQRSALCYVYLSDLDINSNFDEDMTGCRW
ncbi:HET domain [Pyrenophora seminiperda CCB06]|uniref:HET domain n=1 Tax=Pyrenophora seminiperda CCB06 TaxID=1302712 RepID=A0A3M7M156_9PLEO|nr:HET domain [Pyrenophora seminiperda CCB06]